MKYSNMQVKGLGLNKNETRRQSTLNAYQIALFIIFLITCILQILYRTGDPLHRDTELQLLSWKMAPPSHVLEH